MLRYLSRDVPAKHLWIVEAATWVWHLWFGTVTHYGIAATDRDLEQKVGWEPMAVKYSGSN